MQLQAVVGENYNFMAQPKVIKPRAKFRENPAPSQETPEEDEEKNSYNLMWDRRVIRGNTYASTVSKKNESIQSKQRQPSSKETKIISKQPKAFHQTSKFPNEDIQSPKAVSGRAHVSISTEPYIEILTDKPPELEKEALTDFYIDRPVDRLFVYRKDGVDQEAQIWEGDLFDFDTEVEPILQALLGKTIEQSRMEVLEEEELKVMKQQQKKFEQLRNAEMAEMQRLEAKETRIYEEIEKRKIQYSKQKEQLLYAHQKLLSRLCSKKVLRFLKPQTFDKLEDIGVFRDPLQFGLYQNYFPWLIENISQILNQKEEKQIDLEQSLAEIQESIKYSHKEALINRQRALQEKKEEIQRKALEKEENRRKRKEEKARQLELQRIQEIKEKIQNKIFSRNELRQQINSLILSDIDNYDRQTLFVGVFGGFCGELIRFFEKLTIIIEEKSLPQQMNEDILHKMLQIILDTFLQKGSFEIAIDEEYMVEFINLDPNISLETLNLSPKEKHPEILEILKRNLNSVSLNAILRVMKEKNFEFLNQILEFILKYSFENEKGKNIKFVKKSKSDNIANKIALCQIIPKLETLNLRNSIIELNQKNNPEFDPNNYEMSSYFEAELEDKYTATIPFIEDISVLIMHKVAHLNLRRNFINEIKTIIPEIASIEFYLEDELMKDDELLVQKTLKEINEKILFLDFEIY